MKLFAILFAFPWLLVLWCMNLYGWKLQTGIEINALQKNTDTSRTTIKSSKAQTAPTIYLTFDDGIFPESRYIDSLTIHDSVPLTVFLIGRKVLLNDTTKQVYASFLQNDLIEIANHSYSHANGKYRKYYSKPAAVIEDVNRNRDSLNIPALIARLPGRNAWRLASGSRTDLADAIPVADSLYARGYELFGWDCEWSYDSTAARFNTADEMINTIRHCHSSFTPGHIVILCHDPMLQDPKFRSELRIFIKKIRDSMGRFEFIRNYPRSKHL